MIKEDKVLKKINSRNRNYYVSMGYDIEEIKFGEVLDFYIDVKDLSKSSKDRITAICEICNSENKISISKYNQNFNRNDKGYYSCFNCKNIEKEKTCLKKYGVKSYSMTEEFKITESLRSNGQMRGIEKGRKTMLKRYGVDSYSKTKELKELNKKWMSSTEFKNKSKKSMLEKYGVDHYSKTKEFKEKIRNNKEEIVNKIKFTFLKNYGVEWISQSSIWKNKYSKQRKDIRNKIIETCLRKYGVENVSQVNEIYDKILKSKIDKNIIIDIDDLSEWDAYKRNVRKLTTRVRNNLFEQWDGYDYYDGEYIKNYENLNHIDKNYPTIDHKISVLNGFLNGISEEEISSIDNLCITKRTINCSKKYYNEEDFKNSLKIQQ